MLSHVTLALLLVAAASAQLLHPWNDLRVTYALSAANGFHQLPRTAANATAQAWSTPPELAGSGAAYQVLCPERDPSVCVMFDRVSGNVQGLQVSILRNDTASPYDYTIHPTFAPGRRFGFEVYTVTVFTVNPASDASRLDTGNGAWLEVGPGGAPMWEIPRTSAAMANSLFSLENCVPAMGVHYYYNMSPQLACENSEPAFGLFKDGEMIGLGLQTWGTPTKIGSTSWFEPVPAIAVRPTVPNCPDCLVDWTREFHLISIHIYFVAEPWNIKC